MISFGNQWFGFAGDRSLGFVRLFGYGVRWKDTAKHHVFWSERNKPHSFRIKNYSISLLGRMSLLDLKVMRFASKQLQSLKNAGQMLGFEAKVERGDDGAPLVSMKLEFPPVIHEINLEVRDENER